MIQEELPVVTRMMIIIRRLGGAQLENDAWSLRQTRWMKSSKRRIWTTTVGSFDVSGRVTAAARGGASGIEL